MERRVVGAVVAVEAVLLKIVVGARVR